MKFQIPNKQWLEGSTSMEVLMPMASKMNTETEMALIALGPLKSRWLDEPRYQLGCRMSSRGHR